MGGTRRWVGLTRRSCGARRRDGPARAVVEVVDGAGGPLATLVSVGPRDPRGDVLGEIALAAIDARDGASLVRALLEPGPFGDAGGFVLVPHGSGPGPTLRVRPVGSRVERDDDVVVGPFVFEAVGPQAAADAA